MKSSREEIEGRREALYELIRDNPSIRTIDLAEKLGVSEPTVRRDLSFLAGIHRIERFHGGARVSSENKEEHSGTAVPLPGCKERIAEYAASLVEDGDTIFINTSSTAICMLKYITANNVAVVTNNGYALRMSDNPEITVILTGGEMNRGKYSLTGEFALANIRKVSAKKAFLGCSGLSTENGMTTEILDEVELNQEMLRRTIGDAYILADHSKIGFDSSFVSCPIELVRHIITDDQVDRETVQDLRSRGIEVTIVQTD